VPRKPIPSTHPDEVAERLKQVPALVALGLTNTQIGYRLDVTERTVSRYRDRLGLGAPPNAMSPEEVEAVERMLDEGCSLSEAARTIGRDARNIARRFRGRSQWNPSMAQHFRWMKERLEAL
jgi:Bacterial regulatory proteins, luxR family